MLIEKEVIAPGSYWYTDEKTGLPRKLDVTSDLTKYWHDQGNKMLASGLTVPVPCEHDFDAHPMTPADRLKSNAGWVKEYRLHDGKGGPGNKLFGVVDVVDEEIAKKLPRTIRWTSPWINSFTDGNGNQWNNVISHLALTTRPRITQQAPFPNVAAALSMASDVHIEPNTHSEPSSFCLSRAGRLMRRKKDKLVLPRYPIAFSLFSGVALAEGDAPPKKDKGKKPPFGGGDDGGDKGGDGGDGGSEYEEMDGSDVEMDDDPSNDSKIDLPPYGDPKGDVTMEELLCDMLGALGIHVEKTGSEDMFKRSLYTAAMTKIHELTNKAQQDKNAPQPGEIGKQFKNQPGNSPTGQGSNPIIQQEQQPMYMSLEEINKLDEPLKGFALSVYNDRVKADARVAEAEKVINSMRDAKLKEENTKRQQRIAIIGKMLPKVKADIDALAALPNMALSMGEGGAVVDPMAQTLDILEKGISDLPKLLTTDNSALFAHPQPKDSDTLSPEDEDKLVDSFSRMMGVTPEVKAG